MKVFPFDEKSGIVVFSLNSKFMRFSPPGTEGEHEVSCVIPKNCLVPGEYFIGVSLSESQGRRLALPAPFKLTIAASTFYPGTQDPNPNYNCVCIDHHWVTGS